MPSQKKEWILTRDAFNGLLAHFDEDAERAAEKYELARAELIRLFRYRGCNSFDELADETINRVARKIEEGELISRQELTAYFYGVARNVLREHQRNPESSAATIEELSPSAHPSEDPEKLMEMRETQRASERRFQCFEKCIGNLPPETRSLIVSYYEGEEGVKIKNRQRLAREVGITVNGLRIRLHRIREKLERCVSECAGYEDEG
ncbi:MAG: sigma-70 family RNA polymerase sigma factor [Blastocatellia bacterium]|nr:sigma-70 family RNA polymerase sigma factor [Blastocatellia bacterium]